MISLHHTIIKGVGVGIQNKNCIKKSYGHFFVKVKVSCKYNKFRVRIPLQQYKNSSFANITGGLKFPTRPLYKELSKGGGG